MSSCACCFSGATFMRLLAAAQGRTLAGFAVGPSRPRVPRRSTGQAPSRSARSKVHIVILQHRRTGAFPLANFPSNLWWEQDDDTDKRSHSRVESGKEALAGGDPGGSGGDPGQCAKTAPDAGDAELRALALQTA